MPRISKASTAHLHSMISTCVRALHGLHPSIRPLPRCRYCVLPDQRIRCEQGQGACDGLADEHAVEGILVQVGQLGAEERRGFVEWKRLDLVTLAFVGDKFVGWTRQWQFADAVFERDLPR